MQTFPVPVLIGSVRPDISIESKEYADRWVNSFPRCSPPAAGNLWLVYKWEDSSFRTVRKFPELPQIIDGFDYFRKDARDSKRWRFIRKIIRCALESIDYLHSAGLCHNSISSECLWLTTSMQQEIDKLAIVVTDLGACLNSDELGPYERKAALNDFYQLAFVFLELIVSSFNDDNFGAQLVRSQLSKSDLETTTARCNNFHCNCCVFTCTE